MPTRRVIKDVLAGFLGTYTSRYADFRGYWLFGQLTIDKLTCAVDLLGAPMDAETPEAIVQRLAIQRFKEQLAKSSLEVDSVRSAFLTIKPQLGTVKGAQGDDESSDGHFVEFIATAVMDNGRRYDHSRTLFIAPHDPKKERRRAPDAWGT